MKNILLPAKSSNRIPISLSSVSAAVCLLSAIAVFFAGCKPQEEPVTPDKLDFSGNVARPEWVAPNDYDYTSSMTAVIRVDLIAQYPDQAADWQRSDQDLLAAFSDDTCLGVASPQDGLFFLYITAPLSVSGNGLSGEAGQSSVSEAITLRYYSTHYKNIFEAKEAFPYVNDSRQGSADAPFLPTFVVAQ